MKISEKHMKNLLKKIRKNRLKNLLKIKKK